MRAILVRHGLRESSNQAPLDRRVGGYDPLSAEGVRQIKTTAAYLGNFVTTRMVYTSPYPRTVQSAEIIAEALDMEVMLEPRLKEIDKGEWEGLPVREVLEMESAIDINQRHVARPPGGENWPDVGERVAAFIEEQRARQVEECLIVSHDHPIRMGIGKLLGRPVVQWEDMPIGLASVTVIHYADDHWQLDPKIQNLKPYEETSDRTNFTK